MRSYRLLLITRERFSLATLRLPYFHHQKGEHFFNEIYSQLDVEIYLQLNSFSMKFFNRKRSSPKIEVFFFPKAGEDQNIYTLKGCVSGHVLSVQNAKKEGIGAFFNVLRGQIIFHQKGGHVLQKEDVW